MSDREKVDGGQEPVAEVLSVAIGRRSEWVPTKVVWANRKWVIGTKLYLHPPEPSREREHKFEPWMVKRCRYQAARVRDLENGTRNNEWDKVAAAIQDIMGGPEE